MPKTFVHILLLSIALITSNIYAAEYPATISSDSTPIFEAPHATGAPLMSLPKNKDITLVGRSGDWIKIKFTLGAQKTPIEGWISKKHVAVKPQPTTSSKPANPLPPMVPSVPVPSSMFDSPSSTTPSVSSTPTTPSPAPTPALQTITIKSSSPSKKIVAEKNIEPSLDNIKSSKSSKIHVGLGLSSGVQNQIFENRGAAPGRVFTFTFPGAGAKFFADYAYFTSASSKLSCSAFASLDWLYYMFKTRLQDSSNLTFDTRRGTASSLDVTLSSPCSYMLTQKLGGLGVGAELGLTYLLFSPKDILSSAGPTQLYTGYAIASAKTGVFFIWNIPLGLRNTLTLHANVLPYSLFTENPKGRTGSSPGSGLALLPSFDWKFEMGTHQRLGIFYVLRKQTTDFSGNGSRVEVNNLNEAQFKLTQQTLGFTYDYGF